MFKMKIPVEVKISGIFCVEKTKKIINIVDKNCSRVYLNNVDVSTRNKRVLINEMRRYIWN